MTKSGTLLVPHMSEGKVVEYDLDANVLWPVAAKSPRQAIRLDNGDTLIAGDASRYARGVNPKGEMVSEFTQADMPNNRLGNIHTVTMFPFSSRSGIIVLERSRSWSCNQHSTA